MNSAQLEKVLSDTVASVFEEAVYALVETDEGTCDDDTLVIESLVSFTGVYTGTIALEVEASGAGSITNDLLGNETPTSSESDDVEAIGELANIIAGRFMETWLPGETNYDIGIPLVSAKLHCQTRIETEPRVCRTGLRTDGGVRVNAAVLLGRWA